jgi:MYXO-CTERM domain-containing protein
MKSNRLRSKPASIAKTRWASYAAAGAATALAGSQSTEAAIHYSGRVAERFLVGDTDSFQLDQPGDFFRLSHRFVGVDDFSIFGIASAAFRGFRGKYNTYVSKLSFGQPIAMGNFTQHFSGLLVGGFAGQWGDPGIGFIGFRFNDGAGVQYGWARIKMSGPPHHNFILFDYAYADPGERLRAGQTSSDEQAADQGSLGWLALGAVGLLAWRKSRKSLTARLEDV